MAPNQIGIQAVFDTSGFDAGLSRYVSGLAESTSLTDLAANSITGFGGIANSIFDSFGRTADRVFNLFTRQIIRQAIRQVELFIGTLVNAATAGTLLVTDMGRLHTSLEDITKVSFAPLVAELGNMVDKAAPAFLGIVQAAEVNLNDLAMRAGAWGSGFVNNFVQGMWDAIGGVLDFLSGLANIFTSFLAPGSPPRLLPDLDKWGTEAANVYFGAWAKADFSVFKELSGTLDSLIRSIPIPEKEDKLGVVPRILGLRQDIAAAVDQVRLTGQVTTATMDAIVAKTGDASASVRGYLESMVRLEAANKNEQAAQDELNRATEKYKDLLKPVDASIAKITESQQRLKDAQDISLLQLTLNDPGASDAQKKNAQLEIERIKREQVRRGLLDEQKTVVDAAQGKLDAAKKAQAAAQDEFDSRKELIQLQTDQNKLLQEQLKLMESLEKAVAAHHAAAAGGKAGGGAPFAVKKFNLDDLIPKGIQEKWQAFVDALKNAWAGIEKVFQPTVDAINRDLIPAIKGLVKAFQDSVPDIQKAIAGVLAFAVITFGTSLPAIIHNLGLSIDSLSGFWERHHNTVLAILTFLARFIIVTISATLLLASALLAAGLSQIVAVLDAASALMKGNWMEAWRIIAVATSLNLLNIIGNVNMVMDQIASIVGIKLEDVRAESAWAWQATFIIISVAMQRIHDWVRDRLNEIRDLFTDIMEVVRGSVDTKLNAANVIFTSVMGSLVNTVQGPIDALHNLIGAAQSLFDWVTSHVFNFHINLPSLPSWATPGSPMPLETATRGLTDALRQLSTVRVSSLGDLTSNSPALSQFSSGAVTNNSAVSNANHITYSPTYVSSAPPPSQTFDTLRSLYA